MAHVNSSTLTTQFVTAEKEILKPSEPETNYLFRIQKIVALILTQLNRIADKDRTQIDELKVKYRNATQEAANLTRDLGTYGLGAPVLALISSGLGFATGHPEVGNFMAQQWCPKLGDFCFVAGPQSKLKLTDSAANLYSIEYQSKTSKGGADSANKQEIIGILDKALQAFRDAARAG